jgi:hypothetical protein
VVRTTALQAAHSLPAAETGALYHCATGRPVDDDDDGDDDDCDDDCRNAKLVILALSGIF